jgi:16S rRNA processing protein RimM
MTASIPADLPDQQGKNTGSPQASEPVFLLVGQLRSAHGVHGEITMEVLTDFPERLRHNRTVYAGDDHKPLKIEKTRGKDKLMIISFQEITDRDEVLAYRNELLYIRIEELPDLPEGDYYYHQMIGLKVVDEAGQSIGILTEILETGANDVFVVKPETGPEVLLPAIESVILNVNLENQEITVRPQIWD